MRIIGKRIYALMTKICMDAKIFRQIYAYNYK